MTEMGFISILEKKVECITNYRYRTYDHSEEEGIETMSVDLTRLDFIYFDLHRGKEKAVTTALDRLLFY
jgi:hypothetical protein